MEILSTTPLIYEVVVDTDSHTPRLCELSGVVKNRHLPLGYGQGMKALQ